MRPSGLTGLDRQALQDRCGNMSKEKFERTKPHVSIGTIGHVDHGKDDVDGSDYEGFV